MHKFFGISSFVFLRSKSVFFFGYLCSLILLLIVAANKISPVQGISEFRFFFVCNAISYIIIYSLLRILCLKMRVQLKGNSFYRGSFDFQGVCLTRCFFRPCFLRFVCVSSLVAMFLLTLFSQFFLFIFFVIIEIRVCALLWMFVFEDVATDRG